MAKTIFTKDPVKYIPALADALKKIPEFEIPEWAMYAKSGVSRERPPANVDFWYTRAASILRQLYIRGVVGVGKLRTRYGSRKDRGGKPDRFFKSGGKIIRVILQQAESAGLVEKLSKLQHGRRLTQSGRDFLDSIGESEELLVETEKWIVEKTENETLPESSDEADVEIINENSEETQENEDGK